MREVDEAKYGPKADLNDLQFYYRRLPAVPHSVCNPSKRLQAAADIVSPSQSACVADTQQPIVIMRTAACEGQCAAACMRHRVRCPLTSKSPTQASELSRLTAPSRCCRISRLSPVRASAPEAHSYSSCSV